MGRMRREERRAEWRKRRGWGRPKCQSETRTGHWRKKGFALGGELVYTLLICACLPKKEKGGSGPVFEGLGGREKTKYP